MIIDGATTLAGGFLGLIYGATGSPKFLKPEKNSIKQLTGKHMPATAGVAADRLEE